MKPEDNHLKTLEQDISKAESDIARSKALVESFNSLINSFNTLRDRIEGNIKHKEWELCRLEEVFVVEIGLLKDVAQLREEVVALREKSERKDITVGKKERILDKGHKLYKRLQSICPYNFVLSYDGYKGSYSMDFDDARHGQRICVICGFYEISKECATDKYEVLKKEAGRLVKRDLRNMNKDGFKAIGKVKNFETFHFEPVDCIFKEFKKSAGCLNYG